MDNEKLVQTVLIPVLKTPSWSKIQIFFTTSFDLKDKETFVIETWANYVDEK